MPTAILIDGGFFIKRLRKLYGNEVGYDPNLVADIIFEFSLLHLVRKWDSDSKSGQKMEDLYRIFFYDCPPLIYKGHNPITKKAINFALTPEYKFRTELHNNLKKKRKVALRLGSISKNKFWGIEPAIAQKIIKNNDNNEKIKLTENDVTLSFTQKGVDMRVGLDIAALAFKKLAHQIILVAGDADFVPAAKLARREGIDFILDPLHNAKIADELCEHIDGIQSKLSKKMVSTLKKKLKEKSEQLEKANMIETMMMKI